MPQTTKDQANTAKKKPYHTPQMQKFGNVSDLTSGNAYSGNPTFDGGSWPTSYVS
jgi:hypothetical protein